MRTLYAAPWRKCPKPARNRAPLKAVSQALRVPPCRFGHKAGRQFRSALSPGRQNPVDIGVALEHRAEAILHHDGHAQIGPEAFEDSKRGRGQHAIPQGPQPDHGHPFLPRQACQNASHAYSSILASSTSMTGILSRIG